ncbi:MAG: 3'-5' exonuclease [candidate division KSB1 bacterium]|nr:3'-5' exonuclease [candidate division KSB1 bacterium]
MKARQAALIFDEMEEQQPRFEQLRLERPLVFFDLETTGLDLANDRIVQFAFVKVNLDRSLTEWSELVNPGIPIPPEASRVHHITDETVAGKPQLKEFAPKIREFLTGCDLAGFNVISFDLPLLQIELERCGVSLPLQEMRVIDAQVIFHKQEPRNLAAAYRFYCGRELVDAHDALADVRATVHILDAQLQRYRDLPKAVDALHKYCLPRDQRFVTPDRKFYWKNGEAVAAFGKHRGKSLQWLIENEPDYLNWIMQGDFPEQTKALVADALKGIFPKPPIDDEETLD